MHYIYKITNLLSEKVYIGQTNNPQKRWNCHKKENVAPEMAIHKAMKKYGIDNFIFEVIATVLPVEDEIEYSKITNDTEDLLIIQYESHASLGKGYNVKRCGNTFPTTKETKLKMRQARLGKKVSEEAKDKISQAQLGNQKHLGKKHSEEAKEKCRQARLGKKVSEEAKDKIRQARIGKKFSEETREKLRQARIGQVPWMFGKKHSEETKLKMSQARIGKEAWNKGKKTKIINNL
jgi:group I intron endonuclease